MPSGKTHDVITIVLTAPVFAGAYAATFDMQLSAVVTAGFLFGGLMFGPDLDTTSKQYSRWKFLKILWFPYRNFFKHRSRWSHGLIFGTLLRVVYFMGVATCAAFAASYAYMAYTGADVPALWDFTRAWVLLRDYTDLALGVHGVIGLFVGMWTGGASHTLTDIVGTYIKTGRIQL